MTALLLLSENYFLTAENKYILPFDQGHHLTPGLRVDHTHIIFEQAGIYRIELWGELSPVVGTTLTIKYQIDVPDSLQPLLTQTIPAEDSRYWLRGQPLILPISKGGKLAIQIETTPKVEVVAMKDLRLLITKQ